MARWVMAPQKQTKRRSPISREVGERRMIDAAIELIREKPFSEVGVRDIAKRADINHGFVHVWFGSKNLLLMAARNELLNRIITQYSETLGGPRLAALTDPDSRLLVRLSIWLEAEGVEGIEMPLSSPLVSAVAQQLEKEYKMSSDTSHDAARMAVAIAVGHLALETTFNWGDNTSTLRDRWGEVLGLLAKTHPA
jgi:AcrR family transcriptional regulator